MVEEFEEPGTGGTRRGGHLEDEACLLGVERKRGSGADPDLRCSKGRSGPVR